MDIANRICSIGGSGSSALLAHVENYDLARVSLHEKRKHTYSPDLLEKLGTKRAALLIRDPFFSVQSIFRRKIQHIHEVSMNYGIKWMKEPSEMSRRLTSETNLREYLSLGEDLFNIGSHLNGWLDYDGPIEIIVLKYEYLNENIDLLLKFLKCGRPFRVRKNQAELDSAALPGMKKVYGDLRERILSMPPLITKFRKNL
jgi:hypothetical protein